MLCTKRKTRKLFFFVFTGFSACFIFKHLETQRVAWPDEYPKRDGDRIWKSLAGFRELILAAHANSVTCTKRRVGSHIDGGWFVCADIELHAGCSALSVGIADDYSFDVAIASEFNCSVLSLDPTVDHPSILDKKGKVRFRKLGLGGRDNLESAFPVSTIQTVMATHNTPKYDIVKIDCEGCEIPALRNALSDHRDIFQGAQVLFELHVSTTLGMNSTQSLRMLAEIYDYLVVKNNYHLFHTSLNNGYAWDQNVHPQLLNVGFLPQTCCYELGFIPPSATSQLAKTAMSNVDSFVYLSGWSFRMSYEIDLGRAESPQECRWKCFLFRKGRKKCKVFNWRGDYMALVGDESHCYQCTGSSVERLGSLERDSSSTAGLLVQNFERQWFQTDSYIPI